MYFRYFLMPMELPSSERSMQSGLNPTYVAMKDLNQQQIYTQMNPPQMKSPPKPMQLQKTPDHPPLPIETQVTILTPSQPPERPQPLFHPQPPPLPPKRMPPRRSVSLPSRILSQKQEEVDHLKMVLQRKEEDMVKLWMDLITARKIASRAHRQNLKLQCLIVLLICLVILMSLSAMLFFLIKRLMPS
uniref:ALTO protein n=1 Tax=Eptesicus serotinus polyomavirus TaxID=3139987 RepID=A0AAU6S4Z4_9POLY